MNPRHLDVHPYLALQNAFVLKVDNHRPILYPLDYINTIIFTLTPIEGFALSLLDGERPFAKAEQVFNTIYPLCEPGSFLNILSTLDDMVRGKPSQTGIGADGLLRASERPIRDACKYDPRQFIIDHRAFEQTMGDVKSRCRLSTPINVYTVFTHRCFVNCAYCYAERKPAAEMPLERWRQIIEEMHDLDIHLCSPDNGDTFARRDGVDLLELLIAHGMHFLLSTKAYVSQETIRRLIGAGFLDKVRGAVQRQVQISLDAVDDDVSRRILNVRSSRVNSSAETVENFLSCGIMPKVKAVITGLNCDQPKKIVDLLYPRGARLFHFVRYHRTFHRHTDSLFVRQEQLAQLKTEFDAIRSEYPDVEIAENLTDGLARQRELTREAAAAIWANRMGCGGGWYALGVGPDGKSFLCEQMTMRDEFCVGDARTQSIREIWGGERMLRFIHPDRQQFAGTPCHGCAEFEQCIWEKGRCYRDAYYSYSSIYQPPPLCPHNPVPGLQLA